MMLFSLASSISLASRSGGIGLHVMNKMTRPDIDYIRVLGKILGMSMFTETVNSRSDGLFPRFRR